MFRHIHNRNQAVKEKHAGRNCRISSYSLAVLA